MSAATIERERGDDRDPQVEIEKLQEMYATPDAPEILYVSDKQGVGAGDIFLQPSGRRNTIAALMGYSTLRHANVRISRGSGPSR